jgi:chemotaxis protein methyltransferase CheR
MQHLSAPTELTTPPPDPLPEFTPVEVVTESATELLEQAEALLDYGYSEQAKEALLRAVSLRRHDAVAMALLGRACANLGQWQDAEKWCRQAVRQDNLHLDAYYTLALVKQHQGELAQAIDAMKKVVYIDRAYVLGHYGLADLYHATGSLPLAIKSLDNARKLLERSVEDEIIPGSGGITVERLKAAIVLQQQQWGAEGQVAGKAV